MSVRVSLLPRAVPSALIVVGLGLVLFGMLADLLVRLRAELARLLRP